MCRCVHAPRHFMFLSCKGLWYGMVRHMLVDEVGSWGLRRLKFEFQAFQSPETSQKWSLISEPKRRIEICMTRPNAGWSFTHVSSSKLKPSRPLTAMGDDLPQWLSTWHRSFPYSIPWHRVVSSRHSSSPSLGGPCQTIPRERSSDLSCAAPIETVTP